MYQARSVRRYLAVALLVSSLTGVTAASAVGATPDVGAPGAGTPTGSLALAPSGTVTVDVVSINGSGCPKGTAQVNMAPDNSAFTVTYSDYAAWTGPDVSATEARKNCQLGLQINVPQGFTYAIARADYRGYGRLTAGATAIQRANYYFQGQSANSTVSHQFTGYLDGDWQTTDEVDVASLVFKPCGKDINFNINTSLRVTAGTDRNATNVMMMDSVDGSLATIYQLAWRTCP